MADDTSTITMTFTLTRSEVFPVLVRQQFKRLWFAWLIPVVGTGSLLWIIINPADAAASGMNIGGTLWILALGGFVLVGLPYLSSRAVMKHPNFGRPMTLTISENGMDFAGEHSNAKIGWPIVKGVSEAGGTILIHLKPAGFQIIPVNQISPSETTALRSVLKLHAPGKVKLRTKA